MNKDEETESGFEGIGKRIEHLKDEISPTDEASDLQIGKSKEQKPEPSEKNQNEVYTKPIKYKQPFRLSVSRIFWVVVALIVVISIFSQNTDKPNSNNNPNINIVTPRAQDNPAFQPVPVPSIDSPNAFDNDLITVGQYRCTRYHHDRAQELKPSDYEEQSIESEKSALASLKIEIETTYVDHYSQSSIDHYNMIVNDYNLRLELHRLNIASYNNKVETYNNYLMSNCRKAY